MNSTEKELRKDVRKLAKNISKLRDTDNTENLKNYILNESEEIQILKDEMGEYIGSRILFTNYPREIYGIETFNKEAFGMEERWGSTYRYRYELADGLSEKIDHIIKSI